MDFLFFQCSKKCEKNTFLIIFLIVQPIYKTRRAIFTILQPIFTSVYCKIRQIYYSRDQSHFEKSITNFFFCQISFHFLFFFVKIRTCMKHYFSIVIDILPAKITFLFEQFLQYVYWSYTTFDEKLLKNHSTLSICRQTHSADDQNSMGFLHP